MTCALNHALLKDDATQWSALPYVGMQHFSSSSLELRNCTGCQSTLAKEHAEDCECGHARNAHCERVAGCIERGCRCFSFINARAAGKESL